MEEDIKNVERVIDYIQLESPVVQGLGNAIYTDSLKRLIKGYRELEEKAEVAEWKLQHAYNTGWKACEIISIPKSKIKEKIEELEKYIYKGENAPQDFLQYRIKAKIQVLQELMEDK